MRPIQADMPEMMIQHIEDGDLILSLHELDFLLAQDVRRLLRRALVGRVGEGNSCLGNLSDA
jgi:hypothetical protein